MDPDPFPALYFALLCLLPVLSAFCSFAIRALILTGDGKTESAAFSLEIWNGLLRVAAGILAAVIFPRNVLPALGILAALFILAETIPRFFAPRNPRGILPFFPFLSVLALPWKPLWLLVSRFSLPPGDSLKVPGEEAFRRALEEGEKNGAVESSEKSMVEGVLHLGDRPVSAFMTHRSEIEWLPAEAGREEVREKALRCREQGFFPVIRGNQDNIAGIVSVADIFISLLEDPWQGLESIMKKPRFIPETLSALKAFEAFKQKGQNCLCVMDEYGGFAGSLTVRDLVEEIVGELGGSEDPAVISREDGWLADGSVSLDDLAETPGLEQLGPESKRECYTLAGFILKLAGEIPKTGECFTWEAFSFTVLDLDGNRIDKVLIGKTEPPLDSGVS